MFYRKFWIRLFFLGVVSLSIYGAGRLYFVLTDGFAIGNILADVPHDSRWETRPLRLGEWESVNAILDQEFQYLGKGCQSYVFVSQDGQYVIKFFKYQRFKPKFWLDSLTFIPAMEKHREAKQQKKRRKLEAVYHCWRTAFDHMKEETGLVYVHINRTHGLNKTLTIYDKLGFKHQVEMDRMQFLIQKKAQMICPTIDLLMVEGKTDEANTLIQRFIDRVLSEYARGLADNDHALMQNTGIFCGEPIHVDVGQVVQREDIKDPEVYRQELFNKTYKFRLWLGENHPQLLPELEERLAEIIGEPFYHMRPTHLEGRI